MLAVNNSKSYKVLSSPTSLELITIRIISSTPTIYCLVYIPPRSPDEYYQELFGFLTTFKNVSDNFVLLGDFNFSDINWEALYGFTPSSAKFCDVIFDLNLCQLISVPTHIHGSILDLVLTNNFDDIFDLTVHFKQPLSIPSDHFVITFKIYSKTTNSSDRVDIKLRNFARGDFDGLCHYLSNSDFTPCYQTSDIEFIWCFISTIIKNAIDCFVPTTVVQHAHQPKWFNSNIRHHIKCLCTLKRTPYQYYQN